MRTPLKNFTDFSKRLLPLETAFLLHSQKFVDKERYVILKEINDNAISLVNEPKYNPEIDKRKYNHLKTWINATLDKTDVDKMLLKINQLNFKIRVDSIVYEEEKFILQQLKKVGPKYFFFLEFYELVVLYRQFLLIRLRYVDHDKADDYIKKYSDEYQHTKQMFLQLHDVTHDIVKSYSGKSTDSQRWEDWLREVILDESNQGFLRYQAFVNLMFISHNYKKPAVVQDLFDLIESKFVSGCFYSKRILLNYYNIKLMYHAVLGEYDKAVYYGYLSIRDYTHDSLLYTNNLCAVLLRLNRNKEALELMQNQNHLIKKAKNFYNRIGYVAFYMEALINNQQYLRAENYGENFLNAFADEIIKFRWHLFFSIYLESMIYNNQYEKVLKTVAKYKLLSLDLSYEHSKAYLPVIPLFTYISQLKLEKINKKEFQNFMKQITEKIEDNSAKKERFRSILEFWLRRL